MLHDALAMAAGHDFGEIVVEPFAFGNMVNLAEKNGWHSLQVEAFFDTYERESRIAEYFLAQAYLALEAVRDGEGNSVQSFDQHKAWGIFSGKLKDARAYLDGREGMEAVERIAEYIQQNPLPPLAEDIQAKIATWMGYYARVEKHEDFYGAAVKRIEKVDGNLYYSDFSGVGDGIRLDGSLKTSKRIAKTAFPEYVDIPSGNHLKAIIRAEQGIAELFQMAANERETAIARKITALTYRTCSQNLEPAVEELEIEAAYPGTLTPVQKNRMEAQAKARSLYLEAAEAVEQGLFVPQKDAILGAELLKDAPELTR